MRYAWIREHRSVYPIAVMCRVLKVLTSGYYDAIGRTPGVRAERQARIREQVQQVYEEHHGIYGSWKLTEIMAEREELESACRNTVAAAMRALGLRSRVGKAFVPTTTQVDPDKRPAENLLDQDFTAEAPNRKWVADITYLPTQRGKPSANAWRICGSKGPMASISSTSAASGASLTISGCLRR